MCKNLDGENLANFGQSSISPNFSGAKVSLYTVLIQSKYITTLRLVTSLLNSLLSVSLSATFLVKSVSNIAIYVLYSH